MEEKLIMSELGILIAKSGEEMKFGKWIPTMQRVDKTHYHASSFQEDVLKNALWEKIGFPVKEDFELYANLDTLASKGYVIVLNNTDGAFFATTPKFLIAAPSQLSTDQAKKLESLKSQFLAYDKIIFGIYIFNESKEKVNEFNSFLSYYNLYIEPILESIPKR